MEKAAFRKAILGLLLPFGTLELMVLPPLLLLFGASLSLLLTYGSCSVGVLRVLVVLEEKILNKLKTSDKS